MTAAEPLAEMQEEITTVAAVETAPESPTAAADGQLWEWLQAPGSVPVAALSERRHLSVMVCELVGAIARACHDPEDLSELMHAYETYCAEVIAPYEGNIARTIGSSLLVYFGWSQAHEDDAERALRAALELIDGRSGHRVLRDPALSVRIGVAAGTVVVKERGGIAEIIGQAPTMADKLAGRATPGTVVIESRLRALSGATFTYIDLGDHVLEGLNIKPYCGW
jgi:class 3 adenylate cyclase